jgi:hypothetical protein
VQDALASFRYGTNLRCPKMNPDDVLRGLRQVRYSPRRGRRIGIARIAAEAGYGRTALYNAILTGYVTTRMADHVGPVFQTVQIARNQATLSSFGESVGGPDPRGGARYARRRDDGRLRSARQLKDRSGTLPTSGPHGGRTENALSRGPYGATAQIGPRPFGRPSKQTPAVTDELNAVKQAPTQGPTNPAIRIDVGRLLTKQLDTSQNKRGGSGFKARRRFL